MMHPVPLHVVQSARASTAPDPTRIRHIPFPRNGPCFGTRWSSRLPVGKGTQLSIHLTRMLPTLDGNCGRAAAASSRCRSVLVGCHIRCRSVPVGCHIHRAGCGLETGPYLAYGKPLADPAHRQAPRFFTSPSSYARASRRGKSSEGGRVYPKPPRCFPVGGENGLQFP